MTTSSGKGETASGPRQDAKRSAADINRELRRLIEVNDLQAGHKVGSERELTERFGTTRAVLRNALTTLEHEGLVRRVPGRLGGVFVRSPKVVRDLSDLLGVPELLQQQGYEAGTQVLSANLRASSEDVARRLDIEPGAAIYELVRVRLADGEPISLEHAHLPAALMPDLLAKGIGGSLTLTLRQEYGLTPATATEAVEVRLADAQEAQLLAVAVDTPLLALERVSTASSGDIYEYSVDLFRADKVRIMVRAFHHEDGQPLSSSHVVPSVPGSGPSPDLLAEEAG